MKNPRLRFAPSPTGALHIGGVRTALYNYLLAKKHQGAFILRIEDTDQTRYVPGAEDYIKEALAWCGLHPDEGPDQGGAYGPYRQSERKDLYGQYAAQMITSGHAYYAFDTAEELDARREAEKEKGNHSFKYGQFSRMEMKNSLSLPEAVVTKYLEEGFPYTVRLKVPSDEQIEINDLIRGTVTFSSNELDDKILLKADGMPTYHLANIVDDHLMEISHVIRGEEWLSSTAHHVLLYRALGWESTMPAFAHLPLILKPVGKGKLSKRDGKKLGIPVFPLAWKGESEADSFSGFREFGFDPAAVINFLAFLGWNPGTEQEIFSMADLTEAFQIEKVGKAGARFDFDKAKWFNQQYLNNMDNAVLAEKIRPLIEAKGYMPSANFLASFCGLMKGRVATFNEFWEKGSYFFDKISTYDEKTIRKKWKPEMKDHFKQLTQQLADLPDFSALVIKETVASFLAANQLKFGDILPLLRVATTGTMKGPAIFEMMELLGSDLIISRLQEGAEYFDSVVS